MKWCVFIALLLSVNTSNKLSAQTRSCPELPEYYEWNTASDYQASHDLVKKTLKWLCNTPLGEDILKRSQANAFVMEWLAGTPEFTVNIDTQYLPFLEEHPDLLYPFIHAVSYYKMDHPEETKELKLYLRGYKTIANLASQSKEYSKSPALRPLLKASKKNTIEDYVKKIFESDKP